MADDLRASEEIGAAIAAASAGVRAPAALRERVGRAPAPPPRRRRRSLLALGGVALAAVAAAIVLVAADPAPNVTDAASASLRGAPVSPAVVDDTDPRYLTARVGDVQFPNYAQGAGTWRAVSQRSLRVGSHDAVTVVYVRGAERVAYTVVDGELGVPSSSGSADGYRVGASGDAAVVSWRRGDATCVLASRSASTSAMLGLARWRPGVA